MGHSMELKEHRVRVELGDVECAGEQDETKEHVLLCCGGTFQQRLRKGVESWIWGTYRNDPGLAGGSK